ncbi:PEP-CTERM sorting domain-containing protein [Roseimicrobium sp. ORNL1]|uniref:PEP-CTERM sorting domain-containing protein n=1 Tax=Roseimicrobium sp. ORNL1 TaxID=2711231 RepID=UPI0013E1556A|nr:PEP-CTERM sorting domain-containing protein [Roseimicrobium sp. ORNL1]QIF04051.1 PEP-CTERM sorting domain-containing protein [Roseimicrobium sp. ORNL1]
MFAFSSVLQASPVSLSLLGTTTYDGWINLSAAGGYTGVSFPGSGAWPTTGGNWTAYNPGSGNVGAIGSNTAGSGDALLYKVSNGAGGGPYPAGGSIYFGGFSGDPNINGGTLGVVDTTPLAGVKTIAFQLDIGEASGYDLFNDVLPKLVYTTSLGTFEMTATYSDRISQIYTGDILMPTGYEDIYRNTWGVQFNLDGVTDPILSYEVQFTGVQHAQAYAMQLDTSNVLHATNIFPQAAEWDAGGGNNLWSTAANWSGNTQPANGREVLFAQGTAAVLDVDQTVESLAIQTTGNFTLSSNGSSTLTVGAGGITADGGGNVVNYTVSAPVQISEFNLINIAEDTTLTMAGSITGPGFYKKGEGTLRLEGNNTFTGNSFNRLIITGGENFISGENVYTGAGALELNMKNTTVTLHGGDDRLSSNFTVQLYSRRVVDGATFVGEENAKLVLGDASGKSDQTFTGIMAAQMTIFDEATGTSSTGTASNASIVGGSAEISTLTTNVASGAPVEYWGNIGGAGTNENNISLVKTGGGVQAIGGTGTYVGDTVIEAGMLRLDSTTALSTASHLVLDGGVLGLGAGNFTWSLGTGAGQVEFKSSSGFAAYGAVRTVNLGGAGAQVTWGAGSFVADGDALVLSHGYANNTVEFANAINLGSEDRVVQTLNGSAAVDGRLTGVVSGSGALRKQGDGTLEVTNANTYTGGTSVEAGTFAVAGATGSIDGDVTVAGGGTFQLTNTAAANSGDRVEDSATIVSTGGIINVSNTGSANFSETIGKLDLEKGATTVTTTQVAAGFTNVLNIVELERSVGSTVNFTAATLGTRNSIMLGTAPTLQNGIIGGWATVGNEFATYNGTTGVTAFTAYTTTGESTWTAANTVKITGGAAGVTNTLTAGRTVNALAMVGPTAGTNTQNLLDLAGQQLRVAAGGIIFSGGNSTRRSYINNGTITAGSAINTPAELAVYSSASGAYIGASILDNGTGAVTLVKSGAGFLYLTGANSHSGGTYMNQGSLAVNHAQALGTGTLYLGNGVEVHNSSGAHITLANNNNQVWNGNVTFAGAHNLDFGTGRVTLAREGMVIVNGGITTSVGGVDGNYQLYKVGAGALEVKGSSTYTGGTNIGAGTFVAAANNALGTGVATIQSGATLRVNSGVSLANNIVLNKGGTLHLNSSSLSGNVEFNGGTLVGGGTLNQALTVGGGVGQLNVLAPGNSPGTLSTLSQTWTGGGQYQWEISDVDSGPGIGWDLVDINGTLTITATEEDQFILSLKSLNTSLLAGAIADFDPYEDYSWQILTASEGIEGFDMDVFTFDYSGFTGEEAGGKFSIAQEGNSLYVKYASVPEPTRMVLLLGAGIIMVLRRRRSHANPLSEDRVLMRTVVSA